MDDRRADLAAGGAPQRRTAVDGHSAGLGRGAVCVADGLPVRALPREFGPATTVHDRFQRWVATGALQRLWQACLQRYGQEQGIQWAWQAADGCLVKAPLPPKRAPRRRSDPTRPIGAKTAANATC